MRNFSLNGESALDLQYAMPLVAPQEVTLFQVGDLIEGGSFNKFLDAIDGSYCTFDGGDSKDPSIDGQYPDTLPGGFQGPLNCGGVSTTKVISTSYSSDEAVLTAPYMQRQCMEYVNLGLQGVSVLYSSGDSGVAGVAGASGGCILPNGTVDFNATSGNFNPSFPGTSPFITSVGATQIQNGSSVKDAEMASETVILSGGGFSNVFEMADYQKPAVSTYFSQHAPPYGANIFNNSQKARGFPDVSANGVNYVVVVNGNFTRAFGTSVSTPTFAALVNLISEQRAKAGKSSVGFLNPILYANPGVLNDIVKGGNQGCGTKGFESVEGWDHVTGLGTPDFGKMVDLFMKMP